MRTILSQAHFASCEALVRRTDYDRYLAALVAPAAARPHLFALYAFNYEAAKTRESVSQPMLGQIRLQWWRDTVDGIYAGKARDHEVAQALGETVRVHKLPRALFEALIDMRELDLEDTPFADMAGLETYAGATSGHVMRLAARILGAGESLDEAAGEAGTAYALTGLLRALPFHSARRRLMLPSGMVERAGLLPEDVFAGEARAGLTEIIAQIAEKARAHFRAARAMRVPRQFLPALLPAALVPIYLNVVTRRGFNPFRDTTEFPVYRRQLAMLGAMLRGRI